MNIITTGKRFGSDKAHSEAARCLPLMSTYAVELEPQGIEADHATELSALDQALIGHDKELSVAEQQLMKLTLDLEQMLNDAVSLAGRSYTLATKALKRSRPEVLETFPARTGVGRSIDKTVSILNDISAFVGVYQGEFAMAGAPASLGQDLGGLANKLVELNRRQEAAKRAADTAAEKVYSSRGNIHHLCGLVYLAGRAAFRGREELISQFRYEFMTSVSNGAAKPATQNGEASAAKAGEAAKTGAKDGNGKKGRTNGRTASAGSGEAKPGGVSDASSGKTGGQPGDTSSGRTGGQPGDTSSRGNGLAGGSSGPAAEPPAGPASA